MKAMFPWVGGARLMAQRLLDLIPEHSCFVEVFAGSARVLFAKPPEMSRVEVINDLDDSLVNLFSIVKDKVALGKFIKGLEWLLTSRTQFERFKRLETTDLTPVQQALRTFYLLRVGFAGKLANPIFSYSTKQKKGLNVEAIMKSLRAIHARLSRVYIENLDFEDCIKRYDRKWTFFFCAPPYYGLRMYRHNLTERDHLRLRDVLVRIEGKFLLTYNDVPPIRKLYAQCNVRPIRTRYTVPRSGIGHWRPAKELIITNY